MTCKLGSPSEERAWLDDLRMRLIETDRVDDGQADPIYYVIMDVVPSWRPDHGGDHVKLFDESNEELDPETWVEERLDPDEPDPFDFDLYSLNGNGIDITMKVPEYEVTNPSKLIDHMLRTLPRERFDPFTSNGDGTGRVDADMLAALWIDDQRSILNQNLIDDASDIGIEVMGPLEYDYEVTDPDELAECIADVDDDMTAAWYDLEDVVAPGTLFLTRSAAEEHLRKNYYHYHEGARAYAMTAKRSHEFEHALELLHRIDWRRSDICLLPPDDYVTEDGYRKRVADELARRIEAEGIDVGDRPVDAMVDEIASAWHVKTMVWETDDAAPVEYHDASDVAFTVCSYLSDHGLRKNPFPNMSADEEL